MKRKNFVALLVVLMMVAVLALAGCSQPAQEASTEAAESSSAPASESAAEESPAGDGNVVIGMSIPQLANPYFVSVMNGAQAKCDELGYTLTVVDAGYDVAKQVSDFENFGNQGVDAVIACPIDSNALVSVVDQLHEKGVMVISFAQVIENADAILTLDEYDYGVAIGTNAAEWINTKLDGKAEVLIISQDNVEAVVQRGNGIQETIEKTLPGSNDRGTPGGRQSRKGHADCRRLFAAIPRPDGDYRQQ